METRAPNFVPTGSLWKPLEFIPPDEDGRFDQWWRLDTIPELHLHVVGHQFTQAIDKTYCLYEMGAYASVEEALDDWCRADLYQLVSEAYHNATCDDPTIKSDLDRMSVDEWTDDLRDHDADIGEYARHRVKEAVEVWRADHN